MDSLDVALIGCGGIADAHIEGYRELYAHGLRIMKIKAVCDIYKERAKRARYKISEFQSSSPKVYTNVDDLLKCESLDAADICLPHNLHHTIAIKCLEKDLHIIIEKPLGITMRAAKLIIECAERRGKTLAVAENCRRTPENRAIWWAIRHGMIGKPRMIIWVEAGWNPKPMGWREDKFMAGGSWVFDGGVHLADLDRYQLGKEATEVYAMNHLFDPIKGVVRVTVDDMTMAIIRYEDDVYAHWLWTRAAPARHIHMRVIYGSNGSINDRDLRIQLEKGEVKEIKINLLLKELVKVIDPELRDRWFPKGIMNTFSTELFDFYEAIINRRRPEVDGLEAYRDMAIPLSFYESATLKEPVNVRDVESLKVEEYQKEINERLNI